MPMHWRGAAADAIVRRRVARLIDIASRWLRDCIRIKMSRWQPTRGKGERMRGLFPSEPGEYPKKVRGVARMNVGAEFNKELLEARIGTRASFKLGRWLELGTHKMKPRPWLSNGIRDFWDGVKAILHGKAVPAMPKVEGDESQE